LTPLSLRAGQSQYMSDDPKTAPGQATPNPLGLEKPVQDHLGKELRGFYNAVGDKPTYLGDPALPEQLQSKLTQLSRRLAVSRKGIEAVEQALSIAEASPEGDPDNGDDR
jgi:hypothetical protein